MRRGAGALGWMLLGAVMTASQPGCCRPVFSGPCGGRPVMPGPIVVRCPLNCPPYDPEQYGCGPRDRFFVTREYKGWGPPPAGPPRPYHLVPPTAGALQAPAVPTLAASPGVPCPAF